MEYQLFGFQNSDFVKLDVNHKIASGKSGHILNAADVFSLFDA
jgi:hypothetical protein